MKEKIIISEKDYNESKYTTKEWEQSVEILRWEHDFEKKQYCIEFKTR